MTTKQPTPDATLNAALLDLGQGAQAILGDTFTAAYLQGSFAVGDFDVHSDVDWLIVIEDELSLAQAQLAALQTIALAVSQQYGAAE